MSNVIYRGSTPTIRFRPTNGMNVSDLGTPTIAIAQDMVFLTPEAHVDVEDNSVYVTLTEEESLRLVAGAPCKVQEAWLLDDGRNVRFPIKELQVEETLIQSLAPESEETTGEETEE